MKAAPDSSRGGVLLVANYDSNVGFAWWLMESFWVKLAEHYAERNVFLAFPQISRVSESIQSSSINVVEIDFSKTVIGNIAAQLGFLRRHRIRLIYFSDMSTWHWRFVLYRLFGVRLIVVHDHTPGVRTPARNWKAFVKRILHKMPMFTVDGAIGATEYIRQRLVQVSCVPADRCYAAPNGLPNNEIPPRKVQLRQLLEIPEGKKVIVMTGRAHRYKGIGFMLEVINLLPVVYKEKMHFVFIGSGPDLEYFQDMARSLQLQNICTFAGYRSNIVSLLAGADIAVHPSRGEVGYSLSILEYMRAGLPVIVPDNPSVCGATIDGVTGIIYPEGDVPVACEALLTLLSNEQLRWQMGKAARLESLRYSLEETHRKLIQAFSEIEGKMSPGMWN
ncbi:MAG: glycosyltransferase family 4 protein [Desulfobulbaceae bacterium]|nr:MAG: glycosyltransferase family 4 protein [Desulfobulbaceae bacterium]